MGGGLDARRGQARLTRLARSVSLRRHREGQRADGRATRGQRARARTMPKSRDSRTLSWVPVPHGPYNTLAALLCQLPMPRSPSARLCPLLACGLSGLLVGCVHCGKMPRSPMTPLVAELSRLRSVVNPEGHSLTSTHALSIIPPFGSGRVGSSFSLSFFILFSSSFHTNSFCHARGPGTGPGYSRPWLDYT